MIVGSNEEREGLSRFFLAGAKAPPEVTCYFSKPTSSVVKMKQLVVMFNVIRFYNNNSEFLIVNNVHHVF